MFAKILIFFANNESLSHQTDCATFAPRQIRAHLSAISSQPAPQSPAVISVLMLRDLSASQILTTCTFARAPVMMFVNQSYARTQQQQGESIDRRTITHQKKNEEKKCVSSYSLTARNEKTVRIAHSFKASIPTKNHYRQQRNMGAHCMDRDKIVR